MTRTLVLAAFIAVAVAAPASAAPFTVTKTADTNDGACAPGNCSLRDAVIAANAAAGPDTINVPAGHFTLTGAAGDNVAASGDLDLTQDVTITGAGAANTTIDANGIDRIFDIFGSTTQVALSGVTLTGGSQQFGAAIQTVGAALSLDGVDLLNNVSSAPSASGFGAITDATSGNSALTITNSTLSGNTTGGNGNSGFGVINFGPSGSATVTIKNSTFTANRSGGDGAGSSGFGILEVGNATTGAITIDGSHFRNNRVGGAADSAPGFGVINYSTSGTSSLSITDTDFRDNVIGGGSGGGSSSAGFGTVDYGGSTTATFTVTRSTFSGNVVGGDGSAGFGGALDFTGGSGNTLSVVDSTLSGNTAGGGGSGFGGAIDYGGSGATLSIVNSTLTGNSAGGGGGSGFGGAVDFGGATATLNNVTMASNSAGGGGGTGFGGGYNGASTTAVNTIIGDNLSNGASDNCDSVLTSGGHNIENGTTCGFTQTGDQNAEPLLASLGAYGGPTPTAALLPGSPAIDHGSGCPATDQRGLPRPHGAGCDVGAYEFAPPAPTTGGASAITSTSAVLGGTLVPNLRDAAFHFDFGTTTSYGSHSGSQTAGGLAPVGATATLSGLTPKTTYHYRLVASGDDTVAGADATFTTKAPTISQLKLNPARFPAAPRGGSITRKRKTGTKITYTSSDAGKTTFKALKPVAGRRQGKSCRKPSARNRRGRKCTRFVSIGKFSRTSKAGANRFHFTGRIHRHKLLPGRYKLQGTLRVQGKTGPARRASFKVIP